MKGRVFSVATIKENRRNGKISPEVIGLTENAVIQLRQAVYRVGTGELTIDEAVAGYGSFTQ